MDEKELHRLSIKYFEGDISLEEEKMLFAGLKETPEYERLFRCWELDWKSYNTGEGMVADWERLQNKLRMREYMAECEKWTVGFHNIWRYVAAAVVIVVAVASLSTWFAIRMNSSSEEFYTVVTANGERSRVLLADGTSIYLNSGSTLRYSGSSGSSNRQTVELDGEAYFEVEKQGGEGNFSVVTSGYEIVVKGTKFDVSSYLEDSKVTTNLLEGSIDIYYDDKNIHITPGEVVQFDRKTGRLSVFNADTQKSLSWMNGDLIYDRISLEELIARLSRKYDIPIQLDIELDAAMEFSISLRNDESIESVLNALAQIIPVRPVKDGDTIMIMKR